MFKNLQLSSPKVVFALPAAWRFQVPQMMISAVFAKLMTQMLLPWAVNRCRLLSYLFQVWNNTYAATRRPVIPISVEKQSTGVHAQLHAHMHRSREVIDSASFPEHEQRWWLVCCCPIEILPCYTNCERFIVVILFNRWCQLFSLLISTVYLLCRWQEHANFQGQASS